MLDEVVLASYRAHSKLAYFPLRVRLRRSESLSMLLRKNFWQKASEDRPLGVHEVLTQGIVPARGEIFSTFRDTLSS